MLLTVRRSLMVALALAGAAPMSAMAQPREIVTFAGAIFTEAGRGDRMRAIVDRFNASQGRIEVQPIGMTFAAMANTVFTQMGGGGGPDVIRFDYIDYFAAVAGKRVLQLDDVIDERHYRFRPADRALKIDGKRYAVVFDTTSYALLYNPTLLPGGIPPRNFEEFLRLAREATKDGAYGFAFRATMAERAGFWQDLCNFVYGFGGRWSTADGTLTINSPKVVDGVRAYKAMYDSGATPKGTDAATYRRMFWEGKLAMEVDNGAVPTIFKQSNPALPLAAAFSPFPNREQGLILTALVINANTKAKDASIAFMRWLLEPEQQRAMQDTLGTDTAIQAERTSDEKARAPWLETYDAQGAYSISQLVTGHEVKTPEIQQVVLEQVLKVLQAGMDPQRAMDEAQRLVERRVAR